ALDRYRLLRRRGQVDDMTCDGDVRERASFLIQGARDVLATIEECVHSPYTPQGLYDIFRSGFLPVPQLMYCRDEFPDAVRWTTKVRNGRVDVYEDDKALLPRERMSDIHERIHSG
ncbi:hypothetical protein LCGC14_1980830, partial [marine sediment metagenome]